ncbi:MAG: hypothetical protein OXI08_06540 [Cyanobacteria bacterium MAG IRC4_bin_6]|nr:hypothetical protein [Cyanobacteria bacterium MAG IRC4_bin_6]
MAAWVMLTAQAPGLSTLSFMPVTITICAVAQLPDVPDVKVNV